MLAAKMTACSHFRYCSSIAIPIFLYNGYVVIAAVGVMLDDNRLMTIAVVVRTDLYANRPNPDAGVFRSGR